MADGPHIHGSGKHTHPGYDKRLKALEAAILPPDPPPPPPPPPPPDPPPPTGRRVDVSSLSALYAALADTTVGEIVLANGTYPMTWIDVSGTRPGYARTEATKVLVRAETDGGVTFDAQGSQSVHMLFRNGASWQEWRGFQYADSHPYNNGVIQFGEGTGVPSHHLTLRNIRFLPSIQMAAGPGGAYRNGQGIYCSWATGTGNHDLLIDGFTSDAKLWSAVHVYHDDAGHPGHDITFKRLAIGPDHTMGLALWSAKVYGYLFEDVAITGANERGVYHNYGGTYTLRRVTTTGSGLSGYYSFKGTYPNVPGTTFEECSFA